jgi:hypothetical protein
MSHARAIVPSTWPRTCHVATTENACPLDRAKLDPKQLVYAWRMIVAEESRAHVARSLGVDPSTLRRLLMKG